MIKKLAMIFIVMLILAGCGAQAKEGTIILPYEKPLDFSRFEVFVGLSSGFPVTGWDGTAWVSNPNAPADWDGTTNTLKIISSIEPIVITGLTPGIRYYVRVVVVDTSGNRSAPSVEYNAVSGGSSRAAALIVAASDARPASKAGADYVCDGVDDQDTINEATANLPAREVIRTEQLTTGGTSNYVYLDANASSEDHYYEGMVISIRGQQRLIVNYVGLERRVDVTPVFTEIPQNGDTYSIYTIQGKLILTEGRYNYSGDGYITSFISVEGQGSGTELRIIDGINKNVSMFKNACALSANTFIKAFEEVSIKNLKLDGNRINRNGGLQYGCNLCINGGVVSGVITKNFYYAGILWDNSAQFTINQCVSDNNYMWGIYVKKSKDFQVVNNTVINSGTGYGLAIATATAGLISGNNCNTNINGMHIVNTNNSRIENNICRLNKQYGIEISDSSNNAIANNFISENSQAANNAYDNMFINILEGSSNNNNIQGNVCRRGTLTNKPRYGIQIGTGCTNNLVTNNDCYESGVIGGILNNGTNTNWGAGNRKNDGTWGTGAG